MVPRVLYNFELCDTSLGPNLDWINVLFGEGRKNMITPSGPWSFNSSFHMRL